MCPRRHRAVGHVDSGGLGVVACVVDSCSNNGLVTYSVHYLTNRPAWLRDAVTLGANYGDYEMPGRKPTTESERKSRAEPDPLAVAGGTLGAKGVLLQVSCRYLCRRLRRTPCLRWP